MNQPLVHNGFRFYQSSFRDAGHGKEASILSVAYDPGRTPKYIGSLMICVGITTMFYMRAYPIKRKSRKEPNHRGQNEALFVEHHFKDVCLTVTSSSTRSCCRKHSRRTSRIVAVHFNSASQRIIND